MAGFEDFPIVQPAGNDTWANFPMADGAAQPPTPPAPATPSYVQAGRGAGDMLPETAQASAQQAAPAAQNAPFSLTGLLASLGDGTREGMAMAFGAPVDLVNNAPRLLNLIPGVDGVGPMTDNPIGGRDTADTVLRGGGVLPDYVPQNGAERITNRVGQELGATVVPVGGLGASAARRSVAEINRMATAPRSLGESLYGTLTQPMAVNPSGAVTREMAYATAGGTGAGIANEIADQSGSDAGPMSDFLGSVAGVAATALGSNALGALYNLGKQAVGAPATMNDVASEAVANRIINASTAMQEQAARGASQIDTSPLVTALRNEAPVERAVPGYKANIADRTNDPSLSTLVYNTDAAAPGAASVRRAGNDAAVNETMSGMAPDGNPARFRADLQSGVDRQIADALGQQSAAQDAFDSALQDVTPQIPTAEARGSLVRGGLSNAYDTAQQGVNQAYDKVRASDAIVDPESLVRSTKAVDANLAPNDAKRFRPPEAETIQQMMPGERAPLQSTGVFNEYGRPIYRDVNAKTGDMSVPNPDGSGTTVPVSDIMATRAGLVNDIQAARAAGQDQQAFVASKYVDEIDNFLAQALDPGAKELYDQARAARRNVADRFERPGTANADVLRTREGGGYAMDNSAVAGRYAQPDSGRLSDLKSLLAEAGTDSGVRDGLANEVLADVEKRGLVNRPDALGKYLGERKVLMGEFPELRTKLEAAGASKAELDKATKAAQETQRTLSTPGRSPEASYLDNGDMHLNAVRTVLRAKDPAAATRQLVSSASSPNAVRDLRTALWEEVKANGQFSAKSSTGETRWNGRKLAEIVDDPKFDAVAKELWKDDPEDLANIKTVFRSLAGAEGSTRAKAPGTSGTPQSLSGKFDRALSATHVASNIRNVNRRVMSPQIAIVDLASTWLRRRAAQAQSRAIDEITAKVVNNPGMAADLLEKYNPATYPAYRRMMLQKYGVRATEVLNIIDQARNEDPTLDAVQQEDSGPLRIQVNNDNWFDGKVWDDSIQRWVDK